jgi:hypothetical protein
MKNINSFFKPASEQAKKFHALTEDARYMESQNKLNEAKVVKEKARLADIDVLEPQHLLQKKSSQYIFRGIFPMLQDQILSPH